MTTYLPRFALQQRPDHCECLFDPLRVEHRRLSTVARTVRDAKKRGVAVSPRHDGHPIDVFDLIRHDHRSFDLTRPCDRHRDVAASAS